MLSFRNTSFEDDTVTSNHLENGTVPSAIANNNSLHKPDHMTNGKATTHRHSCDQPYLSRDYPHVQESSVSRSNRCSWHCKITPNAIDAWSRVLFPLAYGLFIVAYWILYSSNIKEDKT